MRKNADRIAIYSRKSRFTGKGESIGNQIELCRSWIGNAFGGEWTDKCSVFEDEGFSGGNLNRPALQQMMEQVRQHRFRAIVVYRLDRISRSISDFSGLIEELTRLDVSFISIREQFDTGTPMGRAMMFIISVFSQLERETIAERIRDNMHELAKTGRWLGGNFPTGFTSESVSKVTVDGKVRKSCRLKVIEEEAALVRLIFDLYRETDSLTATEAELLRQRRKTKTGREFTRFAIRGILQNPVYMTADADAYDYFAARNAELCFPREACDGSRGIMAYNRTDQEKGKTTLLLPVDRWIVAVGQHPGLIPARQWIAVQQSLERNKSRSYRKPRSNEALLTGLLYCACGERMYPRLSGRKNREGKMVFSYVCKMKERSRGDRCACRNLGGNALDAAFLEQLRGLPESHEQFCARMQGGRRNFTGIRDPGETRLTALRGEYSANARKMEGLIDALGLLEDSAAKGPVAARIEKLAQENEAILRRIRELETRTADGEENPRELARLREELSDFGQTVEGMTLEEKRAALRALVRRAVWDGSSVRVELTGGKD